jgi:hypothetical protein
MEFFSLILKSSTGFKGKRIYFSTIGCTPKEDAKAATELFAFVVGYDLKKQERTAVRKYN